MEVVLRLLTELRFVLIAICGICCAAFLFAGLGSLRDLRRAVFRLERSAIFSRVISSWLKAGLCLIIAAGIWVVSGITPRSTATASENPLSITPTVAISTAEPTAIPTADLSNALIVMTAAPTDAVTIVDTATLVPTGDPNLIVATQPVTPMAATLTNLPTLAPAPTLTPMVGQAEPTTQPAPTGAFIATLEPPPISQLAASETPIPAAPAAESFFMDCPNADAQISSPTAGETVSGAYNVRGTAGFLVGGKYKVEILRPNIEGWAFLWENHNSIKDGVLMPNFNSGLFPPGTYVLRLMIVDAAGQETGIACRVSFRIAG